MTPKGLDDLLAAGKTPRRLRGPQADELFACLHQRHYGAEPGNASLSTAPMANVGAPRARFPLEVFPTPVAKFVEQVARSAGCPIDFPGVAALVIAGAAVGAARGSCIKGGWVEQPGMYAAIVAAPGRAKTPALKAVMNPIFEEQDRLRQDYRAAMDRYQEELAAYRNSQRNGDVDDLMAEPAGPPVKPAPMRHLFTTDSTVEALAVTLDSNPKGILHFRDEITGWVRSMDQYRRGADRQFFLSAWSNETVKVDRKSSPNGSLVIRHPFLSVLGGVQPDMLTALEARQSREDGFLDRLLFSYPEDQAFQGWTDHEIDEETQQEWQLIINRLLALEPSCPEGASHTPRKLYFSDSGKQAFARFVDDLAAEVNTSNYPARIVGVCAKLKGYTARFALTIHLLRWAAGEFPDGWGEEALDEEDVRRAVALANYFKGHAMVVHNCLQLTEEDKQVDALLAWMRRNNRVECTPREVVRANVAGLKKTSDAAKLLQAAAERQLGSLDQPDGRQRSSRFVVNHLNVQGDQAGV